VTQKSERECLKITEMSKWSISSQALLKWGRFTDYRKAVSQTELSRVQSKLIGNGGDY